MRDKVDTGAPEQKGARGSGRKTLSPLLFLFPFFKPHAGRLVGVLFSLIFAASAVLSLGYGIRMLINQGLISGSTTLQLEHAIAFLITVVIVMSVASYWRLYLVTFLGEHILGQVRRQIFSHLLMQPISFFEQKKTGELLSCLHTDTTLLQVLISNSIPVAFRNLLIFIGGTVMLFLTSVKLASMVFLIVPLIILPLSIYGKRVKKASRKTQEASAKMTAVAGLRLLARPWFFAQAPRQNGV